MGIRKLGAVIWTVAVLAALGATQDTAAAQQGDGIGSYQPMTISERPLASRAELEAELTSLERMVASSPERGWVYQTLRGPDAAARERLAKVGLGSPLKVRAEAATGGGIDTLTIRKETVQDVKAVMARMETVRQRLETGDFRTGDVVEMRVRNDTSLTGTFPVNRERQLELPMLPPVDLAGVLYSEVESALREKLGQYIKEPHVRARALWRVAVVGGVGSPGYYDLSPSTTLSDALMRAGGPSQQAKLDDLEFRRGGQNILEDRERPVETLTLAELGAQRGDQLYVPARGQSGSVMGIMGVLSGLSGVAWAVSRVF